MKNIVLLVFVLLSFLTVSSQKMITRTGEIKFEASMPALEEIAAINSTVSCIFDPMNGDFVTLALVKAFKFKVPLMEEHFNESYIESTAYPKATFKGKIIDFDKSKLQLGKPITFLFDGVLTLHGVSKPIKNKITFAMGSEKLTATSNFVIKNSDFQIKIPNIVKNKVSENVKISLNFILEEKK